MRASVWIISAALAGGLAACNQDRNHSNEPPARQLGRDARQASEDLQRGAEKAAHEARKAGQEFREGWHEGKKDTPPPPARHSRGEADRQK